MSQQDVLLPAPQVSGDQDIADLLSALAEGSTTAAGGLYAAALPPSPADNRAQQQSEEQQEDEGLAAGPLPAAGSQGGEQGPAGSEQAGGESGKVRAVCSAVRRALQSRDPVRRAAAGQASQRCGPALLQCSSGSRGACRCLRPRQLACVS